MIDSREDDKYTLRFGLVDLDTGRRIELGEGVYFVHDPAFIGFDFSGVRDNVLRHTRIEITDVPRKVIWALRNAETWSVPEPEDEDEDDEEDEDDD